MSRRNGIERIERRIERLSARAAELLEEEVQAESRVGQLRNDSPSGRLRAARRDRALGRAERHLAKLRDERAGLVEAEIRAIMLSLRQESSRTRERLDRQLERLAPLEQEWERLRSMFDALGQAIETPAVTDLARQWQGGLEIPDFPVTEEQGYIKPFPPRAILF